MYFEHIFYSSAIAILIGMLFFRYAGRDSSWIIILCAWAPDVLVPIHDLFHNIAFLAVFTVLSGVLLSLSGIKFFDSFFFAFIGYGAHLFEDALVVRVGYQFLWPFSREVRLGLGVFPGVFSEGGYYIRDFFRIANTQVLLVGLIFLLLAIIIRTFFEGPAWIRWYMPEKVCLKLFGKLRADPVQP